MYKRGMYVVEETVDPSQCLWVRLVKPVAGVAGAVAGAVAAEVAAEVAAPPGKSLPPPGTSLDADASARTTTAATQRRLRMVFSFCCGFCVRERGFIL